MNMPSQAPVTTPPPSTRGQVSFTGHPLHLHQIDADDGDLLDGKLLVGQQVDGALGPA